MLDRFLGVLAATLFALLRRMSPQRASNLIGRLARRIGPFLPEHKVGRRQLAASFPDRDPAWVEATLRDAWENLGRVAGEYVHLDRIWDYDEHNPDAGRVTTDAREVLERLRDDGLPALLFTAHLGNWELPAVAAQRHGLPTAVVYRMPNNRAVADQIVAIRAPLMGRLISARRAGAFEMAASLERGEHLGMLVDQFFGRGVPITFFGRETRANPTLARLARRFDCPVYGVRVIRRPGLRFHVATTGPLDLPRDAEGQIDIAAATQMINTVVEDWVREEPAQWLWFHRRWR
ncbi:MAG: lipid A biosynthesis lauroyl acyltransferase [Acetobacteraceae bacterium]|nr:lipid A biosynthesis lauroyl acyltransferase [Acetobacteraceae bacterium]